MHRTSIAIDAEMLRQLYFVKRLPMTVIGKRLGCSSITVARRLRANGITARPRGPIPLQRTASASRDGWSSGLAWAIGLIATDGNLSPDGRHLVVRSKDADMLETLRGCLGLTYKVAEHSNGRGGKIHCLQWSDRLFYRWLMEIGLTPAKSLTLGALSIPDEYFADFFRGCIDGDGSIRVYTDRYHVVKCDLYVYERLYVSIVSASETFIQWLQSTVSRLTGTTGSLTIRRQPGRNPIWKLSYAKAKSIRLIGWMYYAPNVPCLERKRQTAERFLSPLGFALAPAGRPRVGWIYQPTRLKETRAGWFPSAGVARILGRGRGGTWHSRRPQKPLPARA